MSRLLWRNCFDLLENIETTNKMTLWMRRRRKPRGLSCRQHILMRLQKLAERCWDFERGNEAFVFRVRHQPGRGRKSGFKYIEVLERVKTIHWHCNHWRSLGRKSNKEKRGETQSGRGGRSWDFTKNWKAKIRRPRVEGDSLTGVTDGWDAVEVPPSFTMPILWKRLV